MTMIAGFRCDGGIVLCADRQITAPGYYKYYEKKILTNGSPTWKLTLAYSGLPGLAKEAREKIVERIHQLNTAEVTTDVVAEIAETVFDGMGRQYTDLQLQMLIAVAEPLGEPELLKFDGKGLHVADNFNYLGVGDSSLIRFLSDTLYSPHLRMEQAVKLGIYLLRKAEQYIDGIGGPIDVVTFHWLGDDAIPQEKVADIVEEMEEKQSRFADLLIGDVFSTAP